MLRLQSAPEKSPKHSQNGSDEKLESNTHSPLFEHSLRHIVVSETGANYSVISYSIVGNSIRSYSSPSKNVRLAGTEFSVRMWYNSWSFEITSLSHAL